MKSNTFRWPKETSNAIKTRLEFVYGCLKDINPANILDIGCGTGELLTQYLARLLNTSEVIGFDTDERSIEFASQEYANIANLKFITDFPEHKTFDAIIASEILEHVENPCSFLQDLLKSLNDEGILIITVPNGYGCSEIMAFCQNIFILSGIYGIFRKIKYKTSRSAPTPLVTDTLAVSPHINFFSFRKIEKIFINSNLIQIRYRGRMFLHNFICSAIIDKSESISHLNAHLGKILPSYVVSDWMFGLKKKQSILVPNSLTYKRNAYEKLRRYLNAKQFEILRKNHPS
jgi:SAM-dependent methyltransferase